MFEAFELLLICSALGVFYYRLSVAELHVDRGVSRYDFKHDTIAARLCFWTLLLILVCFSGLRSRMNDTATYVSNFTKRIPDTLEGIKEIDWSIGRNPLFNAYQILIRTFVSSSGHAFLFITALFVVSSYLLFLRRYARHFGYSLFFFFAFCVFAFSMAAIKQTMAMAIGIWALPLFIQKKRIRAVFLILIAMLIHPYVVIYLAAPFLYKGVWDRRAILLLIATAIGVVLYGTIITRVLSITASIGDDFEIEVFTSGNAMNIFRFLFYLIVPALSFLRREQIRKADDPVLNACVNLSVLAASFAVFARIGDANMFGRMANYLDVFQCVAFGMIVKEKFLNNKLSSIMRGALVLAFLYFYYTYYMKYVTAWDLEWDECIYDHITIVELLAGW